MVVHLDLSLEILRGTGWGRGSKWKDLEMLGFIDDGLSFLGPARYFLESKLILPNSTAVGTETT